MFPRSSARPDRGVSWRSTACLCICHYTGGACDDPVCASTATPAAVPALPSTTPREATIASSHRTADTPLRDVRSSYYAIDQTSAADWFGRHADAVRDPSIPRSVPIAVTPRFAL